MMTPLRQRMLEELQRRNYSSKTIRLYLRHVAEFAKHFHRSPDQLGAEDIRQYQLFLIQEKTGRGEDLRNPSQHVGLSWLTGISRARREIFATPNETPSPRAPCTR